MDVIDSLKQENRQLKLEVNAYEETAEYSSTKIIMLSDELEICRRAIRETEEERAKMKDNSNEVAKNIVK